MVVGSDADDEEVLRMTEEDLKTANFDILRMYVLQPFPGTPLFKRMQAEGRLYLKNFPEDWKKTRERFVVGVHYELKNLSAERVLEWTRKVGLNFYRPHKILWRTARFLLMTRDPRLALLFGSVSYKGRKWYGGLT